MIWLGILIGLVIGMPIDLVILALCITGRKDD
jgi:hypothetical protein